MMTTNPKTEKDRTLGYTSIGPRTLGFWGALDSKSNESSHHFGFIKMGQAILKQCFGPFAFSYFPFFFGIDLTVSLSYEIHF